MFNVILPSYHHTMPPVIAYSSLIPCAFSRIPGGPEFRAFLSAKSECPRILLPWAAGPVLPKVRSARLNGAM
jgi:hypothetical protein